MIEKLLVFLSSTSHMAEEREELSKRLPHIYELYRYEEDRPRRESPEERCREMIEKSDAFIGVLGAEYGSLFAGDARRRSIVEWELDTAIEQEELEILSFIKKLSQTEKREPEQQALIDRLTRFRGGSWCKWFDTPTEFAGAVHLALEQLLAERWREMEKKKPVLQRWSRRWLTTIAALAVISLLAVALTPLQARFSTNSIIAFSSAIFCVVLICGILLLREMGGRHD